jgi:hypothetical protein
MNVTVGVIDHLQKDYFAGRDLGQSVPGLDADEAALIVAESLIADHSWQTLVSRLGGDRFPPGPKSDFRYATQFELLFETYEVARKNQDEDSAGQWWAAAMASLEEALRSPTASPMLDYEDMFWEIAQAARGSNNQDAIYWLKCGLAHNLAHGDGDYAVSLLRDLAEIRIQGGDLAGGLRMLTVLLHHDPADIWLYNSIALSFDDFGLTELGIRATQRGLALLDARGDPEGLRRQLTDCLDRMRDSDLQGREAKAIPAVLDAFQVALALDFGGGQPRTPEALCRELVPGLDQMPVKRPLTPADLPLNSLDLGDDETAVVGFVPERKLGRNDPCWCGSGKKYKHCHWREDRRH